MTKMPNIIKITVQQMIYNYGSMTFYFAYLTTGQQLHLKGGENMPP